jgi:hypothetical protein
MQGHMSAIQQAQFKRTSYSSRSQDRLKEVQVVYSGRQRSSRSYIQFKMG